MEGGSAIVTSTEANFMCLQGNPFALPGIDPMSAFPCQVMNRLHLPLLAMVLILSTEAIRPRIQVGTVSRKLKARKQTEGNLAGVIMT